MMNLGFCIPIFLLVISVEGLLNNHNPDDLFAMVTNQSNIIKSLETLLKMMEAIIEKQNKTINDIQAALDLQNSTIETLALRNPVSSNRVVAFYAKLTDVYEHLADGQTIQFDRVITNIGNAYEPNQGKFTVPIRGVYLLSVSMMSRNEHDPLWCSLVKNGKILAGLFSSAGGSFSDTQTIIVVLEIGDMVWVMHSPSAPDVHTNSYNSYFAGFLLSEHT